MSCLQRAANCSGWDGWAYFQVTSATIGAQGLVFASIYKGAIFSTICFNSQADPKCFDPWALCFGPNVCLTWKTRSLRLTKDGRGPKQPGHTRQRSGPDCPAGWCARAAAQADASGGWVGWGGGGMGWGGVEDSLHQPAHRE